MKDFVFSPLNESHVSKRIQKEMKKFKSPINYCNNTILIRNNNIVKRMNENEK